VRNTNAEAIDLQLRFYIGQSMKSPTMIQGGEKTTIEYSAFHLKGTTRLKRDKLVVILECRSSEDSSPLCRLWTRLSRQGVTA
jgi:hypothetical protein